MDKLLTLPESSLSPSSIRAKALVFHDEASKDLLSRVERIARSDATVLVTGESGTGKELIARHLHRTSGRHGPFLAVNCGAFSETLIDAELFGHEAGAFTGATQARAGWFEAAAGGTLFLDEIGDLPLSLQVKLLRVLQERQVVRLGSRKTLPLDVRLVAGTNLDLARAVEAQRFRADLYYRLSVAAVELPPLRARPGDILPLTQHFIQFFSARLGLEHVHLSEAAEAALLNYAWPGNIRELENVVHLALIVARNNVIQPSDLRLVPLVVTPSHAWAQAPAPPAPAGPSAPPASSSSWPAPLAATRPALPLSSQGHHLPSPASDAAPLPVDAPDDPFSRLIAAWEELVEGGEPQLYDRLEQALVASAFKLCKQNQVRTARALGISRNVMRSLLKRHGFIGNNEPDSQPGHADEPANDADIDEVHTPLGDALNDGDDDSGAAIIPISTRHVAPQY